MPYHTPAPIWESYGANDFEQYVAKFVVRGRFHKDVPEDVKNSFAVAEHIMANAYYYYPMYEEALAKLLRTIEMSVRMRCEQIGIKTAYTDKKGKDRPKDFNALIDQLAKKEKSKPGKGTLHWLRELRNIFMHPKENMLMGTIALTPIRHTLVQLNALFLPEQFFDDAQRKLEEMQRRWRPFEKGVLILDQNGEQRWIYESKVVEAYLADDAWVYLCAFYSIFNNVKETLSRPRQYQPIVILLREITVEQDIIRGKNVADGTPVEFFLADHPEPQRVVGQFLSNLANVEQKDLGWYTSALSEEIEKEKVRWRCEYWSRCS